MKHLIFSFVAGIILLTSCFTSTEHLYVISDEQSAIDVIMNRRSIRSYTSKQISSEHMDTIIQCAIHAPSARNYQPWEVRIIQDTAVISSLNHDYMAFLKKQKPDLVKRMGKMTDYSVFFHAPTLMVIGLDSKNRWAKNDCGMLAQNILLAAEAMDIGTCCIGLVYDYLHSPDGKKYRDIFDFSEGYEVGLCIAMGYKDGDQPKAPKRKPEKVRYIK